MGAYIFLNGKIGVSRIYGGHIIVNGKKGNERVCKAVLYYQERGLVGITFYGEERMISTQENTVFVLGVKCGRIIQRGNRTALVTAGNNKSVIFIVSAPFIKKETIVSAVKAVAYR